MEILILVMVGLGILALYHKIGPAPAPAPKIAPQNANWLDERDLRCAHIAAGLKCENLSPLHSYERLKWHRARGEIDTENLQMIMWLVHPEWMRIEQRKYEQRTRH